MTIFEKAAQGQLDAYNARDLEDFMKWYDEDIVAIDLDTDTILFRGKEEMKPRYAKRFENKYLHCRLKNRMVLHRTVIDHEEIIWNENQQDTFEAIAIYDVGENGLISMVRFTKGKL
ncbi:nuclear transport factor 2 family protein [Alkaliphilus transvaalensis]|uniref:nuclear transport factor 2 family protein n=1 Tax=Alkaliphilus transvaalensis TaxID=114628 RepID=UPI0004798D17|nr:nuclear transport factor 2 family protein [Alkaliphilus transvaalensis]